MRKLMCWQTRGFKFALAAVCLTAAIPSCNHKTDQQSAQLTTNTGSKRQFKMRGSFMNQLPDVTFDSASFWREKESLMVEVGKVADLSWDESGIGEVFDWWIKRNSTRRFWTQIHFLRPHDSILLLVEYGYYRSTVYYCAAVLHTADGFISVSNQERDPDKITTRSLRQKEVEALVDSLDEYLPNYYVEPREPDCDVEDGGFLLVSSYVLQPRYYLLPQSYVCDAQLPSGRILEYLTRSLL